MKTPLIKIIFLVYSINVFAEETADNFIGFQEEMSAAEIQPIEENKPSLVDVILAECEAAANEHQTSEQDIETYLLNCFNKSLEYDGYIPFKKLPI